MPVFGLPVSLERILNPTVSNETLKSWNMYRERDGCIAIKIRFTCSDMVPNGGHSSENIAVHTTIKTPAVYKPKSSKTIARDKERLQRWKSKPIENEFSHGVTTRSKSKGKQFNKSPNRRESQTNINESTSSIESPRSWSTPCSHNLPDGISPIIVDQDKSKSEPSIIIHKLDLPHEVYRMDSCSNSDTLETCSTFDDGIVSSKPLKKLESVVLSDEFTERLREAFGQAISEYGDANT